MKTLIIVNPAAGRRRCAGIWRDLEIKALDLFPDARVVMTKGPGHGEVIAAKNPGSRLIVVGGDGTFHQVLQGAYGTGSVMGMVPAGSGNDLIRALDIPADPVEALARAALGRTRLIDLGMVNGEYFVNGAGVGFDAKVTYDVNGGLGLFKGSMAYMTALFWNLLTYRGSRVRLEGTQYVHEGRVLTGVAGNGSYLGGGIRVVPHARPDDGLLSFCIISNVGVLKRLFFFAKVKRGTHEGLPFVHMFDDTRLRVESDRELLVHADGEICGTTPAEFVVIPRALEVLV